MIIRMFQYGFRKGKENADYGGDFHSMLLAIQNLIEYLNRNYIVFGIGIAILVIAYCVFYIGDGYIINFEKLFSKLSKKTQYILLGVYVLFLLITAILSFVLQKKHCLFLSNAF